MTVAAQPKTFSVPGPKALPLIGRTLATARFFDNAITYLSELFDRYGPVAAITAGGGTRAFSSDPQCPGSVAVYGPELLRQTRLQHDNFFQHPLTGPLYGHRGDAARRAPLKTFLVSLWGVEQDEHRRHRRLMLPAFHKKRIESYRDDMVAITSDVIEHWQVGAHADMSEQMKLLTMRIATKTLFGEDAGNSGSGPAHDVFYALEKLLNPLSTLLPYDLPGLPFHRFLNHVERFDRAMRAIVARKRAAGKDDGDVLSMLLQAHDEESGTRLTTDEIVGHVGALFAAGHETTANTLSWTLLLLSQHPKVTAELCEELEGELHGAAPRVDQLERLPLLTAVIKESMRVIPVVPLVLRITAGPIELGGYAVPARTEIFTSTYHTHHMPELYPEPERFDPHRWATIKPSGFEYTPFSVGPRMCLGATFAMFELKIVLAMLLQRYRFELPAGSTVNRYGSITLSPKGGLPMRVNKHDGHFERGVGHVGGNVNEMVKLPG